MLTVCGIELSLDSKRHCCQSFGFHITATDVPIGAAASSDPAACCTPDGFTTICNSLQDVVVRNDLSSSSCRSGIDGTSCRHTTLGVCVPALLRSQSPITG